MKDKKICINDLLDFAPKMPPKSFIDKLTESKINIAKTNPSSYVKLALERHKNENIKSFLKSYDNVRKCDNRWPKCESMKDWYDLPEDIKTECFYTHNFSPEHYIQNSGDSNFFEPTVESLILNEPDFKSKIFKHTGYTLEQLLKLKNIINSNIEYIKNSDIVEFAAGDGLLSAIALSIGAKSTTTTDLSDYNINLCKKTKEIGNFNNVMKVFKHDIENFEKNETICKNKDVVLLSGILPLIDNKIEVIKSITNAKPKYIIISELLGRFKDKHNKKDVVDIIESQIPLMQYATLKCESNQSPFWSRLKPENFDDIDKNLEIILSNPNVAWYHFMLDIFGYKKIEFHRWSSDINIDVDERFTAVYKIDDDKTNK